MFSEPAVITLSTVSAALTATKAKAASATVAEQRPASGITTAASPVT